MGLFNTKREVRSDVPAAHVPATWPADVIDEVDDVAFAEAIEKGRAAELGARVTAAA